MTRIDDEPPVPSGFRRRDDIGPEGRQVATAFHAPDPTVTAEVEHSIGGGVVPLAPEYFGDFRQLAREAFVAEIVASSAWAHFTRTDFFYSRDSFASTLAGGSGFGYPTVQGRRRLVGQ